MVAFFLRCGPGNSDSPPLKRGKFESGVTWSVALAVVQEAFRWRRLAEEFEAPCIRW